MVKNHVGTTQGRFRNLAVYLKFDQPNIIIDKMTLEDEHHVHNPLCRPAEHAYRTDCPHEFCLPKRKTKTAVEASPTGQSSTSIEAQEPAVDELIVHISSLVYEMYSEWTMAWEFGIQAEGEFQVISEATVTPCSDPVEWKTITVGKAIDTQRLIRGPALFSDAALEFTVTWSCQEKTPLLNVLQSKLNVLETAMSQMETTVIEPSKSPSIDITHLVFRSKHRGVSKHMYVQSHILTQFEYFERCHSEEYSETQNMDQGKRKRDGTKSLSELLYSSRDNSDDGWDSDSDNVEPKKDAIFKATINVEGTSRRTYKAFIDYAICGALYFAPLRSAHQRFYLTSVAEPGRPRSLKEHRARWPEWAEAHCIPHTVVPGFKTLTSAKSMYRIADMLIIPDLKAICHKQIIDSLDVKSVFREVKSPTFQLHQELRVEAYKFTRNNWKAYGPLTIIRFVTNLLPEEARLVFFHILDGLAPENPS